MAAFYWRDHVSKMCPSDPEKKCVGTSCTAFQMIDKLYAYCGLTKEPQKDELASLPVGYRAGQAFPFIANDSVVPLKDLPKP